MNENKIESDKENLNFLIKNYWKEIDQNILFDWTTLRRKEFLPFFEQSKVNNDEDN